MAVLRTDVVSDFAALCTEVYANSAPTRTGEAIFEGRNIPFVLDSAFELDPSIPEIVRLRIFQDAVSAAYKSGRTPKALKEALNRQEAAYLQKPKTGFVLATSISVSPDSYQRPIRRVVQSAQITISGRYRKEIEEARRLIAEPSIPSVDVRPLPGYSAVEIRVDGRDPHGAAAVAFVALDVLRAWWNYAVNARAADRIGTDERLINSFRLGRVITIHEPDGRTAYPGYYHELNPTVGTPVRIAPTRMLQLMREADSARRRIREHPYLSEIESCLVHYVRAFEEADQATVLVRLWALLERLTAIQGADYNSLVRRAAFIFDNHVWHRLLLQHLRHKRNAIVHTNAGNNNPERLVWQLKRFVEGLLGFHIGAGRKYASMRAFAEFLDLPAEIGELEAKSRDIAKQQRLLKRAMSFRTSKPAPKKKK